MQLPLRKRKFVNSKKGNFGNHRQLIISGDFFMKYPFIQQETNNDCGLACLVMLYRYFFKRKILINDLKQNVNLTSLGISIFDLKALALKYKAFLPTFLNQA